MAETYTTANGRTLIRSMQGWREVSPAEAEVLGETTGEAVGSAAAASLRSFGGLAMSLIGHLTTGPAAGATRQRFGAISAEAEAEIAFRRPLRPEATAGGRIIGEAVIDVATGGLLAPAIAKLVAQRGARQLARRTAAQATTDAPIVARAETPTAAAVRAEPPTIKAADPSLGKLLDDLPQTQQPMSKAEAGATLDAIENVPRYRAAAQSIKEKIFKNSALSTDQARLIESGAVARSGFKLLPGQAKGNNIMVDIVETVPQVADLFAPSLAHNARLLMEKTARSVGLEAKDWGRDILGQARAKVGAMFDRVESAIPEGVSLGDDLVQSLETALTKGERRLFDLDANTSLSGSDLMELRSLINSELSAARKLSAEGVAARELEQTMEALDEIILSAIDDPVVEAVWKEARQRWRMVLALERPGVITP